MKKFLFVFVLLAVILTACGGDSTGNYEIVTLDGSTITVTNQYCYVHMYERIAMSIICKDADGNTVGSYKGTALTRK